MAHYFSARELDALRALRANFLRFEGKAGATPGFSYWESEEELALYDATFGQRIGWKWEAVLAELVQRERLPAGRVVLDWGTGTGIAARRYLAAVAGVERVLVWDRVRAAQDYALERVQAEFPGVEVEGRLPEQAPDVLLVSHVLDELVEHELDALLDLARGSGAVLWVEPGSQATSRRLGALRARLSDTHDVLAPCTHQEACGALASGSAGWCHLFARPPQDVHTEGRWAEFGRELGIDLRSLPYSFLALAQKGTHDLAGAPARLLARPRLTRGRAELTVCDAAGVHALDFLQRTDKQLYKRLDDVAGEPWLFDAHIEGKRITALERRER